MRKNIGFLPVILAVCLLISGLTGCGRTGAGTDQAAESDDKLKIVCTIFPQYDWAKEILGERAGQTDLVLLMKNGTDMHSYQPTVWDMAALSDADLLIYVGGESDFWVDAALENAKNPDLKALSLMEILEDQALAEEHLEGMQEEREHDHSHEESEEHAEHEDQEYETEYDEHVWLSPKNAVRFCQAITEAICRMDEENRTLYEQNEAAYEERLLSLDRAYRETVEQAGRPVLLFGDRFPFLYLAKEYGLTCYAAFAGCSAETEASFHTITFLADKASELSLPAVLAIDGSDQRIARTIAANTRSDHEPSVLVLDSMQSVSEEDMKNGETYLSIMEKNLEVLKAALPGTGR